MQDIDHCVKSSDILAAHINRGAGGREMALVKTKLQEAEHWRVEAYKVLDREEKR